MQWRHVPAVQDGAVDLQHGLPGEPGQLAEQPAVEAEEDPQTLGDREDELAVGDGGAQVAGDVLGRSDILWRRDNGQVYIWLMNGTQLIGEGSPGSVGPI